MNRHDSWCECEPETEKELPAEKLPSLYCYKCAEELKGSVVVLRQKDYIELIRNNRRAGLLKEEQK